MDYIERNTVWGFNERTRNNFNVVFSAWRNGNGDAHVVTQLILSLLGLIVFPYAEIKARADKSFKDHKLADLSALGWPTWKFEIGSSEDLDNLLRHLRNATSHWGLWFSSDSREIEKVDVRFSDRRSEHEPYNWRATINAAELQKFVMKFADLLKTKEQDNS